MYFYLYRLLSYLFVHAHINNVVFSNQSFTSKEQFLFLFLFKCYIKVLPLVLVLCCVFFVSFFLTNSSRFLMYFKNSRQTRRKSFSLSSLSLSLSLSLSFHIHKMYIYCVKFPCVYPLVCLLDITLFISINSTMFRVYWMLCSCHQKPPLHGSSSVLKEKWISALKIKWYIAKHHFMDSGQV